VEELSTDAPVSSPVESVIEAVRNLWAMRDQREALTDAIVHLDGAEIAMDARRTALKESAVNAQLDELEAQRLKMLGDLEELKRSKVTLRETLKQEIRRDEAAAFADAVKKTEQAQAERDRFEYAGASGGYIDYLGYPFCRGRILEATERDEGQYDDRRDLFWVSGAAFCCRAELFKALGGFCGEFFAHMEEIDLCWRMQLAGWRVVVEPRSRVWHLGGGTLQSSSPQKRFYNHRNNLAMLFRCASPMQRVVVAVVRPLLDLAAALSYGMGGDWASAKAVWRAYRDFMAWHRRLSHERREIQRTAVSRSQYIYNGIIPLRYLLGWRKFDKLM
jgi:hypothetical protein